MKKFIYLSGLILLASCNQQDNILSNAPSYGNEEPLSPVHYEQEIDSPVNQTPYIYHQAAQRKVLCNGKTNDCSPGQTPVLSKNACVLEEVSRKISQCNQLPWSPLSKSPSCSCEDVCPNNESLLAGQQKLIDNPAQQLQLGNGKTSLGESELDFENQLKANEFNKKFNRFANFDKGSKIFDDPEYEIMKLEDRKLSSEQAQLKYLSQKVDSVIAGKSVSIPGYKDLKDFSSSKLGSTIVAMKLDSYRLKNKEKRTAASTVPLSIEKISNIKNSISKESSKIYPTFRHSVIATSSDGKKSVYNVSSIKKFPNGEERLCLSESCEAFVSVNGNKANYFNGKGSTTPLKNIDLDQDVNETLMQQSFSSQQIRCKEVNCNKKSSRSVNDVKFAGVLSPADGARRFMAAHYQSCNVLDTGTGLPTLRQTSNPSSRIKELKKTGSYPDTKNKCLDKSESNSNFLWAGMPSYKDGTLDLGPRVDCSGFITGAFAASGLKWTKGQKERLSRRTTTSLASLHTDKNSCMENPVMDSNSTIKAGDVINASSNHTLIIDKVGNDPFGLNKVQSVEGCNSLSIKDFNFSIMQSSTKYKVSGIHRMNIKTYYGHIKHPLVKLGRKVCKTKFTKKPIQLKKERAGSYRPKGSSKNVPVFFGVLRHKGKTEPGCTFDTPPKIKGGECVDNCFKES